MEGWHVKKEVSVGHIVTTFLLAVSGIYWAANTEHAIMSNAKGLEQVDIRIDRLEIRQEKSLDEIKSSLQRIEDKLDRKADK